MKRQRNGQSLDTRDPAVKQFTAECGVLEHAVSIRLIGSTLADVQKQLDRIQFAYGADVKFTRPRQSRSSPVWIAYGTIIA